MIKEKLGISGVETSVSSWRSQPGEGNGSGAQIDLLIDRADDSMNIVEIKFSKAEFVIDKSYAQELRRKLAVFRDVTKTRKSLFLTFVTPFGVMKNTYCNELVGSEVIFCED